MSAGAARVTNLKLSFCSFDTDPSEPISMFAPVDASDKTSYVTSGTTPIIPRTKIAACENRVVTLQCPAGQVISGGRFDYGVFFYDPRGPNNEPVIQCNEGFQWNKIKRTKDIPKDAIGKSSYTARVDTDLFGEDPRPGAYKNFELSVDCQPAIKSA